MSDRRRINGPAGATSPPVFLPPTYTRPSRKRQPKELRRLFLQTGLIPSAGGSSYFELELPQLSGSFGGQASTIKLSCAVHGPKPLSRNTNFSPNLQLTASVKFAPFATRVRRGYVRDSTERDIGVHLENALKAMIIADRWTKSAIDIAVTVLEAEDCQEEDTSQGLHPVVKNIGLMNILAGSITAASAALADAGIDVLDLQTGGVAAVTATEHGIPTVLLDPAATEHETVRAACVVGYLPSRDEVAEIWTAGDFLISEKDQGPNYDDLLDIAILAAKAVHPVLKEAILESAERKITNIGRKAQDEVMTEDQDAEMKV